MGMWLHGLKVAAWARVWAVGGFGAIGLYIYRTEGLRLEPAKSRLFSIDVFFNYKEAVAFGQIL